MPRTYTNAYDLVFTRGLSRADYIRLCGRLTDAMNTLRGITETASLIHIEPEPMTEGGWVFRGGPGGMYNDNPGYKTMRHMIGRQQGIGGFHWPWIRDNVMTEWAISEEPFIPIGWFAGTFLKAFDGAPLWTREELRVFQRVFLEFGIETRGAIPSAANLSSPD